MICCSLLPQMTSPLPQAEIEVSTITRVVDAAAKPLGTYTYANLESGSQEEQDYAANGNRLHNDNKPYQGYKKEKPEHRLMILLKAQGKANKEIAELTGYTPQTVSEVLRQPWARQRLLDEINIAGRDQIYELLRGEVANSLMKVVEIRDTATADEKAVALAASNSIIDRFLGKPTQRVESFEGGKRNTDQLDPAKIDAELARVEGEVARLTGSTTSAPPPVSEAPIGTQTQSL